MGFLFTATMGKLFTMTLGIQLAVSTLRMGRIRYAASWTMRVPRTLTIPTAQALSRPWSAVSKSRATNVGVFMV